MEKKKILLVEDDLTLGDLNVYVLQKHGYEVAWFVRARLGEDKQLIFISDRGVETRFVEDLSQGASFECAVVDSRLKGSVLQGIDVTQILVASGVKVVACSGLPWLNDDMVAIGALCGIEKHDIYTVLKSGDNFLDASLARAAGTARRK